MKFPLSYRVSVSVTGTVDLELQIAGGGTEMIRFPARTAGQMAKHIKDFSAASSGRFTEWLPSQYHTEPGPDGGWQVGITNERKVGILVKTSEGVSLEMALPTTDAAKLIEQLQAALEAIQAREEPAHGQSLN